jgi:hypothetical protein
MTLTTPSSLARPELVAQWAKAVNLCGMVTRIATLAFRLVRHLKRSAVSKQHQVSCVVGEAAVPFGLGRVCVLAHERIRLVAAVRDLQSTLTRRTEGEPVKTCPASTTQLAALRSMVAAGLRGSHGALRLAGSQLLAICSCRY